MQDNTIQKVGIWNRVSGNEQEYYARDNSFRNEWHFWADINKIAASSDRYRIVFMGESVARGYFYDPFFNCGSALEKMLTDGGGMDAEVIDLARTNHNLIEVQSISSEAMALNPDALVVFGGNNWIISVRNSLTEQDFGNMMKMLEGKDPSVLKNWFRQRSHELIESFFQHLYDIAISKNIPVVLVIPEFNLLHWQSSEEEQIVTHLPGERTKTWISARNKAEQALDREDWEAAEDFSRKMIDIDASHPLGYEWVARCLLEKGMHDEAGIFLKEALDTALYFRADSKPRFYSFMRESVLELASLYNIQLVDLSEVFAGHLEGKLPGAELFLDYCHMTYHGIQLSMEATANTILKINNKDKKEVDKAVIKNIKPADDVVAYANFCAAIHNGHFGQPYERLLSICTDALKASESIKDIMINYIDVVTRGMPNYFCKSFANIVGNDRIRQYNGGTGFLSKKGKKIMDLNLVDAIVTALKTFGYDVEEHINELRKKEHGAHIRKVNLLKSYYALNSNYDPAHKKSTYYIARDIASQFFLVAEGNKAVNIKLTYRNPNIGPSNQEVVLKFNNKVVLSMPASEKWFTQNLIINDNAVNDGMNYITISWPLAEKLTMNEAKQNSEHALFDYSFPVLGEIYLFTASQNDEEE
jgi:hypothetical protein